MVDEKLIKARLSSLEQRKNSFLSKVVGKPGVSSGPGKSLGAIGDILGLLVSHPALSTSHATPHTQSTLTVIVAAQKSAKPRTILSVGGGSQSRRERSS